MVQEKLLRFKIIGENRIKGDNMVSQAKDTDFVLEVDDIPIPTGGFVKRIFKSTILGMISSLRGVEEPRKIIIKVRYD